MNLTTFPGVVVSQPLSTFSYDCTVNSCFDLVGSRQHGVALILICSGSLPFAFNRQSA